MVIIADDMMIASHEPGALSSGAPFAD